MHVRVVGVVLLSLASGFAPAGAAEPEADAASAAYRGFIAAAGNAESDAVRLGHLRKLARQCETDGVAMAGLAELIRLVEDWTSPELRLDFFRNQVQDAQDFELPIDKSSPLYPIGAYYRARMLVWVVLEYSSIYPFPEKRKVYLDKAIGLFEVARRALPENRVIGMYLGEPIEPERRYDVPPGAPAWAVSQRESLERLTDVIEWWIDHGMRPDGQYGGGWGDDCEMWRHWVPVLVGFDHPQANWAQSYFSRRLLAQPHLAGGYHNKLTDVEHSAEDLSDALVPMMLIEPDNPEWSQRARRLVDLAEQRWTGRNERGLLQFKSTYFTVDQVDLAPERACDTVYHPRAMQPALLYWQRTGDERMTQFFSDWMRTWVDAAARNERGKPAGMLPTAIHWPDGQVGGAGRQWWLPENYSTPLYDFPSVMSMMLNTLLLAHRMTGQDAFLEPIRSMAAARLEWLEAGEPEAEAGSPLWCAARLDRLAGVVAKYRFLTGDRSFDALLSREDLPYVHYRLKGDLAGVTAALGRIASVLRVNFPAYTREVRYTDRVFRFPILYEPGFMFEEGSQPAVSIERGVLSPGLNRLALLYNTLTGDPGDPLYFPMNAVRWRTPPRAFAALVREATGRRFVARLYHFGPTDRRLEAELFLLEPGAYTYTLVEASGGNTVASGRFRVTREERRLALKLPKQVECKFEIARVIGVP